MTKLRSKANRASYLIDDVLSDYQHVERHSIDLECDQETAYDAARALDFSGSKLISRLFHLRGLDFGDLTLEAMTTDGNFHIIGEDPPAEFVIVHANDKMNPLTIASADDFKSLKLDNGVKIAWNFRTEVLDDRTTRLHTETRIACEGKKASLLFKPYWFVVKPFSGIVRKEMLKAAASSV